MKNMLNNSEFLQSQEWRKFQESVGRRTFCLENEGFLASVIEHNLPIVGKYFYVPRGPIFSAGAEEVSVLKSEIATGMKDLMVQAKNENAGWIRLEPENVDALELIKENIEDYGISKAPHDMQPKEIFVVDISKGEDELLAEMKPKTRYNINLARKKGVVVSTNTDWQITDNKNSRFVEEFLRLTKEMAIRHGIIAHPEIYYRMMIESLPSEMLRIYVAQFEGKIIAANLVLFYGKTATYLHGASGNENRNVMAPFLLQWQAMLDAKELGCEKYDFGGVKILNSEQKVSKGNSWEGITTFKLGFSPQTKPVEFPGAYDIIINPRKYAIYKGLQEARGLLRKIRR